MKNIIWGKHMCVHSTPEITKKEDNFVVLKTSHKEKRSVVSLDEQNKVDEFLTQINMDHRRIHYVCPGFFLNASITCGHRTPAPTINNNIGFIISHSPIKAKIEKYNKVIVFRGDIMYVFSASRLQKNHISDCYTCLCPIKFFQNRINFFMEDNQVICEKCCSKSKKLIDGIVINFREFYELSGFVIVRDLLFDVELGYIWKQPNTLMLDQNNIRGLATNCFEPIKINTYRKMLFI